MGTKHKELRPRNRRDISDGMKLHLRELRLSGQDYHLVTLRPGTRGRFGTDFQGNYYREIATDVAGSHLLARLLWGLSYQRKPGTLIAIHGEHVAPNLWDGSSSLSILLLPTDLTSVNQKPLRALHRLLPYLRQPDRTIRWHTFSMAESPDEGEHPTPEITPFSHTQLWRQEHCEEVGGFLCYSAPPQVLRYRALEIMRMNFWRTGYGVAGHLHMADSKKSGGVVHVFLTYNKRIAEIVQTRREILTYCETFGDSRYFREKIEARQLLKVWKRREEKWTV